MHHHPARPLHRSAFSQSHANAPENRCKRSASHRRAAVESTAEDDLVLYFVGTHVRQAEWPGGAKVVECAVRAGRATLIVTGGVALAAPLLAFAAAKRNVPMCAPALPELPSSQLSTCQV
jgi:hypothetical protein